MYNFAVIGTNFIVDWFLEASKDVDSVNFYGVYSRTLDRATEYAQKYGVTKTYTSIDELANDENVDFIYIASPNTFHEEQAYKLIKAKKHIFCEKPATLTLSGLDRLLDLANENNCIFKEGMVPLYMPAFKRVVSLLPQIGAVRNINFEFCQYSSRYDRFKNGIMTNAFNPTFGGGALMDLGIYCVEFLIALFGVPKDIGGNAVFLPDSIDAVTSLVCSYDDKTAVITASKVSDGVNQSQIQGENGSILIDKLSRPKKITLCIKGKDPVIFDMTPKKHEMSYEIEAFVNELQGNKNGLYNDITRKSIELCEKARKNIQKKME